MSATFSPAARVDGAHEDGIWDLSWALGNRVVTCGADEHLGVWSAEAVREKRQRVAHVGAVSVAASPRAGVVTTLALDCVLRFWRVSGQDEADEGLAPGNSVTEDDADYEGLLGKIDAGPVEAWKLAYSPDGRHVASGTQAGALNVWEVATGTVAARFETQDQFVMAVAYNPRGTLVACGGIDGKVNVFDVEEQRLVHRLEAHAMAIRNLVFSRDGTYLFTASDDGTVNCWDAKRSFLFVQAFEGHKSWVLGLDAHPNGRNFVTGSADRTVRIWDIAGSGCVQSFDSLHADQVWAAAFNDDGSLLATAGEDCALQIYSAAP